MKIYPAIDIKNGEVVRLTQGDYDQVEIYSKSPVEIATRFENLGATHLHVVDLDGAKDAALSNFDTISAIRKNTSLFIEVGGGIRDQKRINQYIEIGVNRTILGTVALENPGSISQMIALYGNKIAVGVDAKDEKVAIKGWLEVANQDAFEFCQDMQRRGVQTIIYTDISKDGMMSGSNLDVYEKLCKELTCNIIASGGVSSLSEFEKLKDIGVSGVIVGKALYEKNLSLQEILQYES